MMIRPHHWPSFAALCILVSGAARSSDAQEAGPVADPFSQPAVQSVQVTQSEGAVPPGVAPQPGKSDGETGKPDSKETPAKEGESAKEAKPGDAADEAKKEEKPSTVKRPVTPPAPADPTELEIRAGADGRVRFNFRGQSWPDVLEWLATVSGLSLDWQELPGDYLNLLTQRSYTVQEARDLVNRHLLVRGYTLLVVEEVMTVAKIEKINAALVPRVEPEELARRLPHEYVKVSFPLDWLIAESAVDELKPMLSPNGRLTALKSTNRLEALDAAANLRELYEVLKREQSVTSQERLVREFVLVHARATDVSEQLKGLLGLDAKSRGPQMPTSPQQMEMMQQQQQQQQQQMMMQMQEQQQRGGRPAMPSPKAEANVNLVVNPRRNSLLVHAPPDKLAIIAKAVEVIDVPLDRDQSLLLNINRMQVYRLAQLDPESLIRTLQDSGDLDPTTRLEPDRKNKAIIVYAPLADHLVIRTLVDKLDGSGRQFEVVRLRRLEADYVAGTISFMMGQEQKTAEQPRYYGYWDSRPRPSDESSQDKFRVDADVVGNRLLVWANDIEMEEIRKLLVKLGEIPSEGPNLERVRVLDIDAGEDATHLLEQIRRTWPALAPNPIVVPPSDSPLKPSGPGAEPSAASDADGPASSPPEAPDFQPHPPQPPQRTPAKTDSRAYSAPIVLAPADMIHFARLTAAEPPVAEERTEDPIGRNPSTAHEDPPPHDRSTRATADNAQFAPVQIAVGPDGRLVISSQDTAALDLLEELLSQLAPARKDFKIFSLKYASAFWIKLSLQDYFKEEPDDSNRRRSNYYYFDYTPPAEKEKSYRLSQRKPLKFIDDLDTNTILVVGATGEQLQTIEELVRLWDTPPPSDTQSARLTAVFAIRYSKAEAIAETLKEVYLDLLSSNDKALQRNRDDKRTGSQTTYIFGEGGNNEPDRRTQVAFKGKLSIGVDALSNTLLVSTEGQNLMDNVSKMIQALDEAAIPVSEVRVLTLSGNVNAQRVRQALTELLGEKAVQSVPAQAAHQPPFGLPQGVQLQAVDSR